MDIESKIRKLAFLLGWKFDNFNSHIEVNRFQLTLGYDRKIIITLRNNTMFKFSVYINNPKSYPIVYRTINCNLERNIRSLEIDIKKRLLSGYDDAIIKTKKDRELRENNALQRKYMMDSVTNFFNLRSHWRNQDVKTFSCENDKVNGNIELNPSNKFDLRVDNLPADKLMKILTIIDFK